MLLIELASPENPSPDWVPELDEIREFIAVRKLPVEQQSAAFRKMLLERQCLGEFTAEALREYFITSTENAANAESVQGGAESPHACRLGLPFADERGPVGSNGGERGSILLPVFGVAVAAQTDGVEFIMGGILFHSQPAQGLIDGAVLEKYRVNEFYIRPVPSTLISNAAEIFRFNKRDGALTRHVE